MEHEVRCPICQKDMDFKRQKITYDKEQKEFERKTYQCVEHDTWICTEVPKEFILPVSIVAVEVTIGGSG